MKKWGLFVGAFLLFQSYCQGQDSLKEDPINDTIYGLEKVEIHAIQPKTLEYLTVSSVQMNLASGQQMGDLLFETGKVAIQKSQTAGGSPILRGFEANRVGLEFDGIRLNNLIYRSGHQHYILMLDPFMVEKIQINQGPQSVNFGSDAIGGVLAFTSKKPELAAIDGRSLIAKAKAVFQFDQATSSHTEHFELQVGLRKFAFLGGVTITSFGAMTMGKRKNPFGEDIGVNRYKRIARNNLLDTLALNSDSFDIEAANAVLKYYTAKIKFAQSKNTLHELNFNVAKLGDIQRNDRLSELSGDRFLFKKWNYSPQSRSAVQYLLYHKFGQKWLQNFRLNANFQGLQEGRITQKTTEALVQNREEKVKIFSISLDAETQEFSKLGGFKYGLSARSETLESKAFLSLSEDNTPIAALDTRYPDGGSKLSNISIYLSHEYERNLSSESEISFQNGIRLEAQALKSKFESKEFFDFPFDQITQNNLGMAAHSLLSLKNKNGLLGTFGVSTGYRIPNVDDLAKVFDTRPQSVILPNDHIKPEYSVQTELELQKRLNYRIIFGGTIYHTVLFDALLVGPGTYLGQDSVVYQGAKSKVFTNQNASVAHVSGVTFFGKIKFFNWWQIAGQVTYTRGTTKQKEQFVPMDHIQPLTGKCGITYDKGRVTTSLDLLFNGAKPLKLYAPNGEDNAQYATINGTPAWMDLRWNLNYMFRPNIGLQLGVNNILDHRYRVFASGVNAPGRSIWFKLSLGL